MLGVLPHLIILWLPTLITGRTVNAKCKKKYLSTVYGLTLTDFVIVVEKWFLFFVSLDWFGELTTCSDQHLMITSWTVIISTLKVLEVLPLWDFICFYLGGVTEAHNPLAESVCGFSSANWAIKVVVMLILFDYPSILMQNVPRVFLNVSHFCSTWTSFLPLFLCVLSPSPHEGSH